MARRICTIQLATLAAAVFIVAIGLACPGVGLRPTRALAAETATASPPAAITLTDAQDVYYLGSDPDVYLDESSTLTLDDILSPDFEGQFMPLSQLGPIAGDHALWLRVQITNQAAAGTRWLMLYDEYRLNEIAVYLPDGAGYRSIRTGNTFPFSSRDIAYRAYAFRLDTQPGSTETVYVRLSDLSGLTSLKPLKIETQSLFNQEVQRDYFWAGVFYSVVLTVLFWGVLFIFSLRERAAPAFAAFLLSAVLLSLSVDGLGQQFLWPGTTSWTTLSLIVSAVLFLAALVGVTLKALDVDTHLPRWALAANVLVGLLAGVAVLRFSILPQASVLTWIALGLMLACLAMPLVIAVRMIPKLRLPALTFLIGFTAYLVLLLVGVVLVGLNQSLNLDPWSRVALIWLLLVFSAVIHQRINSVHEDRERAREQLISEQQDALRIQRELTELMQGSRDMVVAAYDTTLEGWARLLETRDKETEGHCRNVAELTVRFAEALGMGPDDLVAVRRGALLHDIGKIAIPDSVLLKPGALTPEERSIIEQHPLFAQKALEGIPFLDRALDIPVYHHERWDGTGYPYGLAAEQVPLSARMFAIVDNWDALLSDRPYRSAWPVEDVVRHLEDNAGTLFDPAIVPVFIAMVGHETCAEAVTPEV